MEQDQVRSIAFIHLDDLESGERPGGSLSPMQYSKTPKAGLPSCLFLHLSIRFVIAVATASALAGCDDEPSPAQSADMMVADSMVDLDSALTDSTVDAAVRPDANGPAPDAVAVDAMVHDLGHLDVAELDASPPDASIEICPPMESLPTLLVGEPVPLRLDSMAGALSPVGDACSSGSTVESAGAERVFVFDPGPGWWLLRVHGAPGQARPVVYARAICERPDSQLACAASSTVRDGDTRQRHAIETGAEPVFIVVDSFAGRTFEGELSASPYEPPAIERAAAYLEPDSTFPNFAVRIARGTARSVEVELRPLDNEGNALDDWESLASRHPHMADPRYTVSTYKRVPEDTHRVQLRVRNIDRVVSEVVEVMLIPELIAGPGEPCDPARLFERCPPGEACDADTARCALGLPPTVDAALVYKEGRMLYVVIDATDPNRDLSRFEVDVIDAAGDVVNVVLDFGSTLLAHPSADYRLEEAMEFMFGLDAVRAEVTVFDRLGLESEPLRVPVDQRPRVGEGAACDLGEVIDVCDEGTRCAEPESMCLPEQLDCPEAWGVIDIGDDHRDEEGWVFEGSTIDGAVRDLSRSCDGGGPAQILRFVVPSTGAYGIFFEDPVEDRARPQLHIRRNCRVPQTEASCGESYSIALPFQRDDVLYLVVDGTFGWAGDYRLRIDRVR